LKRRSESRSRSDLRARLEARREEIEAAALTRVRGIEDPELASDPTYAEGLRAAVASALDYALEAIGTGGENGPPPPVRLLAQARLAARNGVSLDTVLRRYLAGYTLLGYFTIEEAGRDDLMDPTELKRLLAVQASLFDRLLAAIGEEHARESEARLRSTGRRQAERIIRLLEGELIDTAEIAYDFEGHHLGAVASGPHAEEAIRSLAEPRDCRLLTVEREEGTVWAWLGTRTGPEAFALERVTSAPLPAATALSLGEPGEGLAGWRLTHRQAVAALPIALRGGEGVVLYREVALLAAAAQDGLLAEFLHSRYLAPLEGDRDDGESARLTLQAYFAAERNLTSAAATLGISRQAVRGRLRTIEERLGHELDRCAAELELALRLHEMKAASKRKASSSSAFPIARSRSASLRRD
jgi:hypothetical protein